MRLIPLGLKAVLGFNYYDYGGRVQPNANGANVWKYTETTLSPPTPAPTEDWQKHVNSNGITNWDDHLRSQGIDPAELQKQNEAQNKATQGEQWYNPMLECKQGHTFNGDTAPEPIMKMKYMATPSYPSRTLGVFKCKWTIQKAPNSPLIKLIFSMIDFECNGLNPTVRSWGTSNHIQITDKGQVKTIYCGKKQQTPYYSESKEVEVEIQVNTAGFGKRGSRAQIIYQSVKARGTPKPTRPAPIKIKPTPPKPTQPIGGFTLGPPRPQGGQAMQMPMNKPQLKSINQNIPQHSVQIPQQPQQPMQTPQEPVQPYFPQGPLGPYDQNMGPYDQNMGPYDQNIEPYDPNMFPSEFNPHLQYVIPQNATEKPADQAESESMVKSTIGLAIGGVIVLILVGGIMFLARSVKTKISNWKSPGAPPVPSDNTKNVVDFVNELVSSNNAKTISEEPLRNTLNRKS